MATGESPIPVSRVELPTADDLPFLIQIVRYLIAGGTAFLADLALLALLTEAFQVHYLISALASFLLGLVVNYALSVKWVFTVRAIQNPRVEFLVFSLVGVVGLVLNELVLWGATQSLRLHYLHAKILATAIVLVWNFSVRKFLLFSSPRTDLLGRAQS